MNRHTIYSANFTEHKVTLPKGIELHHLSIRRAQGHGSYWITYELEKDGELISDKLFTHDSQLWDDWDEESPAYYENAPQSALDLVLNLLS